MFDEMGKSIDAVSGRYTDHTHAITAATAIISMGKHVYVQKPLTHSFMNHGFSPNWHARTRLLPRWEIRETLEKEYARPVNGYGTEKLVMLWRFMHRLTGPSGRRDWKDPRK
jgi:hypothetical protein